MHFFLPKSESQNRTSFPGKAQCFCFWSLMISLSTAIANKSASSSSRKELPSWLPALLRVSAAEPKGCKAAHRGGGFSLLTEPCSAHLPLWSRLPPEENQIPEGAGLEETQKVLPEDPQAQVRVPHGEQQQSVRKAGHKSKWGSDCAKDNNGLVMGAVKVNLPRK